VQDDQPKSSSLRELLTEVRGGFNLFAPLLIRVKANKKILSTTADRTNTMNPLDWGEQYTREYANETFILLGPNSLQRGHDQPIKVGRSRSCDARIDNQSVSKVHASIAFDRQSGEYYVIDEHSRNGTCVNGEPISPGAKSPLWPGVYVSFGDAVFVFIDPPTLRKLSKLAV
jgi:hypothetical protein